MIDKEVAELYKSTKEEPKHVRIGTNFICADGEILEVKANCIIFKSNKGISAISLESINTIMCVNGGGERGR